MVMVSTSALKPSYIRKAIMRMILRMIPSWGRSELLKRKNDWLLMSLRSKSYWLGTHMEVLWNIYLGKTMDWVGLVEEPLPTRDSILTEMREDTPMGLVPAPK